MSVSIIGAATTQFGELWEISPRTLAREAVFGVLNDAEILQDEIQALFVGNMLSGMLGGQEHLGAFFAEELGLVVPAFKIEGACASDGLALHSAYNSVLSGQYETVVVLGIEKMTDHKPEDMAFVLTHMIGTVLRFIVDTIQKSYTLLHLVFILLTCPSKL